jgi:hypothetical protein
MRSRTVRWRRASISCENAPLSDRPAERAAAVAGHRTRLAATFLALNIFFWFADPSLGLLGPRGGQLIRSLVLVVSGMWLYRGWSRDKATYTRESTSASLRKQLADWEAAGFGNLPVCMAKTQYSFSTDPGLLGAPEGHVVRLREVRLAAGAGFVVAICGDIMTMPGLPRRPAAEIMHLNAGSQIEGLS